MRTTVDLPPGVHRRARELAQQRGVSLSAAVADLTALGLEQVAEPPALTTDPRSGFPVVRVGRPVSNSDVASALDDE